MQQSERYDAIYLSPHLDDVALSCGAQIYDRSAAGEKVLIVTLMAGDPPAPPLSPFAEALHARWELPQGAVMRRRAEDATACHLLGADFMHWDVPDCIYRQDPNTGSYLYASEEALFGDLHPAETPLAAALAGRLAQLPPAPSVIAPLTIGHHVDHQLARAAAVRCFGAMLSYYEDYPYVRSEPATARAIPADGAGWQAQLLPVSQAGATARIEAIAAFVSQASTFFNDRADLEAQIKEQIRLDGGERLWQLQAMP